MTQQWELYQGYALFDEPDVVHPTWLDIQVALLGIQGKEWDEVQLRLVGKGYLLAGGGESGRYLVIYKTEDHKQPSLTLTDPSLTGPDVILTTQTPAPYPARYAVSFPLMISVFEHFYREGDLPKDVHWEIGRTGREMSW